LATDEGAGTLFTPVALYDSAGALWWLIAFSATSVVAANTNNLMAVGPSAGTGTFYLAGGNAWDATYPTSWQGASLGTRNADQLFLAETIPAQPLACYVHFVEEEPSPFIAQPGGGNFAGQFLTLGGTNAHWLRLDKVATGGTYRIIHQHGAGNFVQDNIDLNPDVGDGVELVGYLYADGSVQLTGRKNGGAVTTGTRSAALQTPSLFADTDVHLGGIDADGGACVGLAAVAVVDGAPAFDDLTLAVCSPYLAFEDDIGEAALVAGVPVLNGWRPDVDKIGDAVERLSDGTRYLFQFRRDYLAEFTVPLLAPSQLTVALRLKEHLLDGGTVTVITSDRDFSAYDCILAPGTEPAVEFADPAVLDYAFRVTLKNTADVPLLARYR
jgi:hypothetical protein